MYQKSKTGVSENMCACAHTYKYTHTHTLWLWKRDNQPKFPHCFLVCIFHIQSPILIFYDTETPATKSRLYEDSPTIE